MTGPICTRCDGTGYKDHAGFAMDPCDHASNPYDAVLVRQKREWPNHLKGAAGGNPYATLCLHCYGRHAPPKDEICPHESIETVKARALR